MGGVLTLWCQYTATGQKTKKKKEKLKPVTVKWPRPGYGTNAIALLNGTMIARSGEMDGSCWFCSLGVKWKSRGLLWSGLFSVVLRCCTPRSWCIFSPFCSSWGCDSLKRWINQTFWWLVFFCAPGQVLFDYSVVMRGLQGCNRLYALHADNKKRKRKK